jgi:hypothetical protein
MRTSKGNSPSIDTLNPRDLARYKKEHYYPIVGWVMFWEGRTGGMSILPIRVPPGADRVRIIPTPGVEILARIHRGNRIRSLHLERDRDYALDRFFRFGEEVDLCDAVLSVHRTRKEAAHHLSRLEAVHSFGEQRLLDTDYLWDGGV